MIIKIQPRAAYPYKGKRARRQAFYGRQRLARFLTRLVNNIDHDKVMEDAYVAALIHGSAWYEQLSDGSMRRVRPIHESTPR